MVNPAVVIIHKVNLPQGEYTEVNAGNLNVENIGEKGGNKFTELKQRRTKKGRGEGGGRQKEWERQKERKEKPG